MVDWPAAVAHARWLAERWNAPWRLATELEWEKAARGVDARTYPWGAYLDPSWCCLRDSHEGRAQPTVVDSFAVDQSPYGVRGLAGNVTDWCADVYRKEGPKIVGERVPEPRAVTDEDFAETTRHVVRGGSWNGTSRHASSAMRLGNWASFRTGILSFRVVRSLSGRGLAE